MKYTKEILEPLIKDSFSVAEVMRRLNFRCLNGSNHAYLTSVIKKFKLNTSHFLGRGRNCGASHVGGNDKIHFDKILVYNRHDGRKENSCRLRKAMIESGIKLVCDTCCIKSMWNGKALLLQISHKDGDCLNNRKENLHFECPNCHSQTEDYAGKGIGKNKIIRPIDETADMIALEAIA